MQQEGQSSEGRPQPVCQTSSCYHEHESVNKRLDCYYLYLINITFLFCEFNIQEIIIDDKLKHETSE